MTMAQPPDPHTANAGLWLRGGVKLAGDAFVGSVNIVHGVHRAVDRSVTRINPAARPIGWSRDFVYGCIRGIGRLGFFGAGHLAGLGEALLPARADPVPGRAALTLRGAINGAFGDHLETSGNALAVPMCLVGDDDRVLEPTRAGLAQVLAQPSRRVAILIHGLGLTDRQWRRPGRAAFGDKLAADFGYTALRLRYNSGRHIAHNGRDLADLLEHLYAAYPAHIERLTLIGHSMGGLVARSACAYARQANHHWPRALRDMVLLGSPHLGAPLERLGDRVTRSLDWLDYTRPLAAIGGIRSAGVQDLRYGDFRAERADAGPAPIAPTLEHVGYYLVAATLGRRADDPLGRWLGDWLVPVASAFGHSSAPGRRFRARDQDGRVFYGMNHFALMYHADVYAAIAAWLSPRLAAACQTR